MEMDNDVIYRSMEELNYKNTEISNTGIVRDTETGYITRGIVMEVETEYVVGKPIKNERNYIEMAVKPKRYVPIDVLVAIYFCPNPDNKRYVKHKNGNTLDDRASNLVWVKYRYIDPDKAVYDLPRLYEMTRKNGDAESKMIRRWPYPELILEKYNIEFQELNKAIDHELKHKKLIIKDRKWITAASYDSKHAKWKKYEINGYKAIKIYNTGLVETFTSKTYGYPTPEGLCINLEPENPENPHKPVLVQNIVAETFISDLPNNHVAVHFGVNTWDNSKGNIKYEDIKECPHLGKFIYNPIGKDKDKK
jgi:hypothetical protein